VMFLVLPFGGDVCLDGVPEATTASTQGMAVSNERVNQSGLKSLIKYLRDDISAVSVTGESTSLEHWE
jgi:hypothetical protein